MADEVQPASLDTEVLNINTLPVAKIAPSAVSPLESFGRGAVEGATFGFDDTIGFDRDRRELSRKTNPWTHFAGELVGGAAPMVASGGIGAGVRAGATAANAAGLTTLGRAGTGIAHGIEAVMLPGQIGGIGSAMAQGAKIGGVYGGLSGAGHAEVNEEDSAADAAVKRATSAAKGAAVGTAIGPVVGAVGHVVGRAGQHVMGARAAAEAETATADAGALRAIQRGLERDRITPDDLIGQITSELPQSSAQNARRALGPEAVEQLVGMTLAGENATAIATALGVTPSTASRYMKEVAERSVGPLNLVDRASLVRRGSGENTQYTMRAAANTPGEARGIAKENLTERQVGALGRMQEHLGRIVGSLDYDGVQAKHAAKLEAAGNKLYGRAEANQQPFDIAPILQQHLDSYALQRGPRATAVRNAVDAMTTPNPSGGFIPPVDIQGWRKAFGALNGELDTAVRVGNRDVVAGLMSMKDELRNYMTKTNPLWREANDVWADGMAASKAMEAGAKMSLKLGQPTRDNLEYFQNAQTALNKAKAAKEAATKAKDTTALAEANTKIDAANARIDLFRTGLVRAINDKMMNKGETHDIVREMLFPGAQQTLQKVLGPQQAKDFIGRLRAEAAQLRTFQSMFGSQTTPLKAAMDDLNWAPRFQGAWQTANPKNWLPMAGEYVAAKMNADRNQRMMPLMTNTNPVDQLQLLRAVNQVQAARAVGDQTVRRPAIASSGLLSDATAAEALPKPSAEGRMLSQARNAISRGAPRKAVEDRLRSMGVDPGKI